mgnify:CR=1
MSSVHWLFSIWKRNYIAQYRPIFQLHNRYRKTGYGQSNPRQLTIITLKSKDFGLLAVKINYYSGHTRTKIIKNGRGHTQYGATHLMFYMEESGAILPYSLNECVYVQFFAEPLINVIK